MFKKVFCICIIFLVFFNLRCFGATKDDVLSAIKETYEIGDDTFRLPGNIIKKAEKYLNNNPLSEEQYTNILNNINGVVGIAQKNGTIELDKISLQDKMKAFDLIADTSKNANIDLDKELAENNIVIEIPKNDKNNNTKNEKSNIEIIDDKKNDTSIDFESNTEDNVKTDTENNETDSEVQVIDLSSMISQSRKRKN